MLGDSRSDGDLAGVHAERGHQIRGIAVRAVRGSEARHGDGDYVLPVLAEAVEGGDGDEQRKRRVEAAGDAQDGGLATDVLQAGAEGCGLDGEYLPAT